MIGDLYKSKAIQAVIGPAHSNVIPEVLWGGFLDGSGALIAMTGIRVRHDAFTTATDGVTNSVRLDCGVAGTGWTIAGFALFDAASGGAIVLSASVTSVSPAVDEPLAFAPGGLTFTYAEV